MSQGQEPLSTSMLAVAPPQEQKQMLGERLFPLIHRLDPHLAGKITGMLLEIDNAELLHMLEDHNSLKEKVSLEPVLILVGPLILAAGPGSSGCSQGSPGGEKRKMKIGRRDFNL